MFFAYVLSYNCNGLICYKPPSENQFSPNLWQQYTISPVVLKDTLLITITIFHITNTEIRMNPRIGRASARSLLRGLDPCCCTTCRAKKASQTPLNLSVCKPFFSLRWLALIINPCGNMKIIVDIPKGKKFFTKTFVRNSWFVQRSLISCYTFCSSKSY